MALSDYLPDFSNSDSMAAWGALSSVLAAGSQPRYDPMGRGISGGSIGNALMTLGAAGMGGAVEGAEGAQKYKSADQANQMKNFDLMYYRGINGLDPNTGTPVNGNQSAPQTVQPGANVQTPFGGVPQMAQNQPQGNPSIQPVSMQGMNAPSPPMASMPPPMSGQPLPPNMAKNSPAYGAMGGVNLPPFAASPTLAATALGPYLTLQEKQMEMGRRMNPDGSISVLPGATDAAQAMSAATEQGKVGATNQINATKTALENASQKDVQNHANYLEFGDNGLGGAGSILPAMSANGANGGNPVPSPHGTNIPDVTQQSPIPRDANSLKAAIPAWQEKATSINDSVPIAQKAQVQLSAIANAYKATQSGSFATDKATIKAALLSAGIKLPDDVFGDPASLQLALHGVQLNTLTDLKSANSRFSTMEFKTISNNSAHPNTQPDANREFIAQDLGAINQQLALANDWRTAQKMGWRNPQDFSSAWMDKNPQSAFVAGARSKIGLLKGMTGQ